jgi:hypothetical protein
MERRSGDVRFAIKASPNMIFPVINNQVPDYLPVPANAFVNSGKPGLYVGQFVP